MKFVIHINCSLIMRTVNKAQRDNTALNLSFMCSFSKLTSLQLRWGNLLFLSTEDYSASACHYLDLFSIHISTAWLEQMPRVLCQLTRLEIHLCTIEGDIDEALLSSVSTLR